MSSVVDGATSPAAALALAGRRETTFIVEMPSMKIVFYVRGSTTSTGPWSIEPAVAEILRLLGS